jgi:ubiquinone/menaquinone biosynthesis C-methylase UbiE
MAEQVKSYDREGALRFPLMPGAHLTAWRYMFDWAVAGEALRCGPGDRVLEFGSGPAYASELLNRLGFRTVAFDLEPAVLGFARERLSLDRRLEPRRSSYVAGDGGRLPFADSSFDGVLCLNALHHMPDYELALGEIRRILKPGCRAVFSEPGSEHANAPESRFAAEQFGAVEKNIHLEEIDALARKVGFEAMRLKPIIYPEFAELDYGELTAFRNGSLVNSPMQPAGIADFLERTHSIFALLAPGQRPFTSRRPNLLLAELTVSPLSRSFSPGEEVMVEAWVTNRGDTLWLARPDELGGYVTFGVKLLGDDGRVLDDQVGRTLLGEDVPPEHAVRVRSVFRLPADLAHGEYRLRFDMVNEQVAWFEQQGSPALEHVFVAGGTDYELAALKRVAGAPPLVTDVASEEQPMPANMEAPAVENTSGAARVQQWIGRVTRRLFG